MNEQSCKKTVSFGLFNRGSELLSNSACDPGSFGEAVACPKSGPSS
jgi:hypothetical protein